MSETHPYRTIPLQALRPQGLPVPTAPGPESVLAQAGPVHDRLQRPLRDLRISVTDRCNFRCSYCMPKEVFNKDYAYLPHEALLTFEEIARLARQFVAQGVQKIRLTGGEPLLRKNLEALVAQLAALRTPEGQPLDLALTTNGALLARKAQALKDAGLRRLTVSLDGLDDAVFRRMNDVDFPVAAVLEGIAAAQAAGLGPIKVNMVVQRGVNDDQVLPMARHFQGSGVVLRFIEYMDVGATNGWRMEQVLPSATLIERLRAELPLLPLAASAPGETAQRWGYARPDGTHDTQAGEIGVIGSVTQAFCGSCNRARLSTEGQLYLCLFAHQGYDLRSLLRSTAPTNAADPSDSALAHAIRQIWSQRSDRYSALRNAQPQSPELPNSASGPRRVEMSYIGG